MLHRDDDQWYQYSREEVDKVAGTVSVNGLLYDAGKYAYKHNNLSKSGFRLSQGSRKENQSLIKKVVGYA